MCFGTVFHEMFHRFAQRFCQVFYSLQLLDAKASSKRTAVANLLGPLDAAKTLQ